MLEIQQFLMGMDGNCREIDLIRGSHPPQRNIKRERGNALSNWFILQYPMLNYIYVFTGDQL